MRVRLPIVVALAATIGAFPLLSASALASTSQGSTAAAQDAIVLAQDQGGTEGGGESEGGESADQGPPWTYQMARIAMVLLVFMALGVFAAYWKFVHARKKSGV